MAAPVVAARSTGRTTTTDTTSHAITMPAGITAGDLLIVVFSVDGAPTCTASGWNKLGQASNSTVVTGAIFWKRAAGSDTCTVTTTTAEQSSHVVLRITGGGDPTGASANGSSTNSNPPSHTAAAAFDHLWIATRSGDSTVVATAAPTNYGNLQTLAAAGTGGASSNTAERTVNASTTEDPGTFTSASEQWVSWTLAVPPPGIRYVGKGTESLVANNTANTPGLPSGLQDGDLLVLLYGMTSWAGTANEPATPSGWTKKASTLSATTGGRIAWYYRRYQAGDTAPTLTYSGTTTDIRFTQIFAFRGAVASGDPTDVLGTASNNATQKDMGPISGVSTTASGGVVLVAGVRESDWQPGGGLTVLSGDGLGWVEVCDREDFATDPGDNIGIGLDYALTPGPTTVTDKTFTIDTGNTAPAIGQMWALLPAGASSSTPVSGSDSASATDAASVSAATARTESGSVTDSASVSATSAASDQMTVSDSAGVVATGTTTDTAAVTDTSQLATSTAGGDSGGVAEAASAAASVAAADPVSVIEVARVGTGTQDSAAFAASAALAATVFASDTAALTEAASVDAGAVPVIAADGGAVDELTALQVSAGGTDAATVGEAALVSVLVASADAGLLGETGSVSMAGVVLQRLMGAVAVAQRLGGTAGLSGRLAGSTDQVAGSVGFSGRVNGAASPATRLVGSASVLGRTAGSLETNRVGGTVDYA